MKKQTLRQETNPVKDVSAGIETLEQAAAKWQLEYSDRPYRAIIDLAFIAGKEWHQSNSQEVALSKLEIDFIVDNALNGLWSHCMDKLNDISLGEVEKKNIEYCRDEAKRLMLKLDPNCFS